MFADDAPITALHASSVMNDIALQRHAEMCCLVDIRTTIGPNQQQQQHSEMQTSSSYKFVFTSALKVIVHICVTSCNHNHWQCGSHKLACTAASCNTCTTFTILMNTYSWYEPFVYAISHSELAIRRLIKSSMRHVSAGAAAACCATTLLSELGLNKLPSYNSLYSRSSVRANCNVDGSSSLSKASGSLYRLIGDI
jgi:hypothetical protein